MNYDQILTCSDCSGIDNEYLWFIQKIRDIKTSLAIGNSKLFLQKNYMESLITGLLLEEIAYNPLTIRLLYEKLGI